MDGKLEMRREISLRDFPLLPPHLKFISKETDRVSKLYVYTALARVIGRVVGLTDAIHGDIRIGYMFKHEIFVLKWKLALYLTHT